MNKVSEGIYRSGRPNLNNNLHFLKTIVNLEDDYESVRKEWEYCRRNNIIFVWRPMSEIKKPYKHYLFYLANIIENRFKRPILIHCKHGHERTGIVIAQYRMNWEGWSKWKAIKEALRKGFNPLMLWWFI